VTSKRCFGAKSVLPPRKTSRSRKMSTLSAHDLVTVQPMDGPTDLTFKFKFLSKEESDELDMANPYSICDGKWGGMGGERQWHVFSPSKDVYEWDSKFDTDNLPDGYIGRTSYFWKRVWDHGQQCWRAITPEELEVLPKMEDKLHMPVVFDKFSFPFIKDIT